METLFEGYDSHDEYLESIQCVGDLFRKRRPYSAAAKEGEQSGKKGKTMFGKKCLWYYLITIESVKGLRVVPLELTRKITAVKAI